MPKFQQWAAQEIISASVEHGFVVQKVLVQGRENTDADVLRALLNVKKGDPILAFNPQETKDLIERISWVREAHVERRFPDTIFVNLTERQPLALWQNKGKIRLIDKDGVTLTDRGYEKFGNLILLVGADAPQKAHELVSMLAAEPNLKARVTAASRIGGRRWDLTFNNGVTVKLPESDMGLALRRIAAAQEADKLLDRDITSVDVREADRMTVLTRPGSVQEYKAGFTL